MSKSNNQPNNEQLAQYLDQEVPVQQLEDNKLNDLPAFMQAQLAYAKSKHCKQTEQKQRAYKKRWFNGGKK